VKKLLCEESTFGTRIIDLQPSNRYFFDYQLLFSALSVNGIIPTPGVRTFTIESSIANF